MSVQRPHFPANQQPTYSTTAAESKIDFLMECQTTQALMLLVVAEFSVTGPLKNIYYPICIYVYFRNINTAQFLEVRVIISDPKTMM